jgi:chemotaxis response regulator CheB
MDGCKIVGIGASAGGLKALSTFFENLDPKTTGSFIVVQHLTREHISKLDLLISRKTKIPIVRVDDSMELEANHIYVMKEGTELEVHENMLQVFPRDEGTVINQAVNRLFFSMAKHCKEKAIGVVLSGTGTDGLKGAKAIEDNGGKILVQSPESAQFDGMPNAVINLDHPDYIDDPADLAKAVSQML